MGSSSSSSSGQGGNGGGVCVDGEGRVYQDFYKMVLENESRTDTPNATGATVCLVWVTAWLVLHSIRPLHPFVNHFILRTSLFLKQASC